MFLNKMVLLLGVLMFPPMIAVAAAPNVVVLSSKHYRESLELAMAYCTARSIPHENILQIDTGPYDGVLSRDEYEKKVAQPVFDFLVSKKLIMVSGGAKYFRDASVISSDLDYVVICGNLPFKISETPAATKPSLLRTDQASVDSELIMLLRGKYELSGMFRNPLFGQKLNPGAYKALLLIPVARLDGFTFDDAHNIYRQALVAERDGLRGRAYIDKGFKYPAGDAWLEGAQKILDSLGYDISDENTRRLMGYMDRMDAAAFYFGWYANPAQGYFLDKGFKMAPGATALHIHSFSAYRFRAPAEANWTPAFVARGAAATFGNVNEPFLHGTHRPDVYCAFIANGYSAGEAALNALPFLSWQTMFVGDPLYMPFKVSLDEQLKRIESGSVDGLSQYSVIRRMNLLDKSEGRNAALEFGLKYGKLLKVKHALDWKLSQYFQASGDSAMAVAHAKNAIGAISDFSDFGLAYEILRYLDSQNLSKENAPHYAMLINSAFEGHDDYLRNVLPELIKSVGFPSETKERYEEKNLELNSHPKQ